MKRAIIIILVIVGIIAVLAYGKMRNLYSKIYKGNLSSQQTRKERDILTVLLMGYGGGVHEGTYLTDSMMVARVDLKKNTVALISIPRDLWVKVPTKNNESFYRKINAVYQLGLFPKDYPNVTLPKSGEPGAALVKQVAGEILGIDVHYYLTVDFEGFREAIDTLGGVTVNVQKTFDDYEYPIEGKEADLCGKEEQFVQIEKYFGNPASPEATDEEKIAFFKDKPELAEFLKQITEDPVLAFPCRYEHIHFDKGPMLMDGETALKYVRSRHSLDDGGDFGRAARQQQFIEGVKDKVLQVNFVSKIVPLMDKLSNHISTDMPADDMQLLINEFPQVTQYTRKQLVLSTDNVLESSYSPDGQYILITAEGINNWQPLHAFIKRSLTPPSPTYAPASQ